MSEHPEWFTGAREHLRRELGRVPDNLEDLKTMPKPKKRFGLTGVEVRRPGGLHYAIGYRGETLIESDGHLSPEAALRQLRYRAKR